MAVVQDDGRETELRELFALQVPDEHTRGGVDAILRCPGGVITEFELKSTTTGSVTTVRDFGPDHVEKWRTKHWIIGVYSRDQVLQYCLHGTPELMAPWINEKAEYVAPDFKIGETASQKLNLDDLGKILGPKETYSLADAKRLHKKQYSVAQYRERMDRPNGYSPERMLEILQHRAAYIASRGSTLNNPHIPAKYFAGWPKITADHAGELRRRLGVTA